MVTPTLGNELYRTHELLYGLKFWIKIYQWFVLPLCFLYKNGFFSTIWSPYRRNRHIFNLSVCTPSPHFYLRLSRSTSAPCLIYFIFNSQRTHFLVNIGFIVQIRLNFDSVWPSVTNVTKCDHVWLTWPWVINVTSGTTLTMCEHCDRSDQIDHVWLM